MSGIVGIVNLDGSPVDHRLLRRMTEFMAFRGPDLQETWSAGNVGFGTALLRTTNESLGERQPFSLDGEVWITADARIDGRADLIGKLKSKVAADLDGVTDAELILRAYAAWGEECLEHLLGDFAFAIWDERKRCLFCARDHFGVKPFYYARLNDTFVFSNTLNCVRMHPEVSDELNEQAVGDFLLFDFNQNTSTTIFSDVQRLAPAHSLSLSNEACRLTRYWRLPTDGRIRYRGASDYVDHFKELLCESVSDRLRTENVSIFMSGGLDSTAVAAIAVDELKRQGASFDMRAYTAVYEKLFNDEEGYYAGLVAKELDIPIHYVVADKYGLYDGWDRPELRRPEPYNAPLIAISSEMYALASSHSRVALSGDGGDPVLYPPPLSSHFLRLAKRLRVGQIATELWQYLLFYRRLPGLHVRTNIKRLFARTVQQAQYPQWLSQDFKKKLDARREPDGTGGRRMLTHPERPEGYRVLSQTYWPYCFENEDPSATSFPCEVRYPFFDLRLVNYLLAIPPVPWCRDKELLRQAMRGILPEQVRVRRKSPLPVDPAVLLANQSDMTRIDNFSLAPALAKYVDRDRVPGVAYESDGNRLSINLRPFTLNYWLKHAAIEEYKSTRMPPRASIPEMESRNEIAKHSIR
jgi:asparagine synthase (glutamine-hydrolysing)